MLVTDDDLGSQMGKDIEVSCSSVRTCKRMCSSGGNNSGGSRDFQMILTSDFSSLLLQGDSLSVIEAIGPKEPNFSRQGNLVFEIQSLLSRFVVYDIIYVGRQENEAAHLLARHPRFMDDTIQWAF